MEVSNAVDDALSARAANLAALEERKREVKSKLRAVTNSLRDAGAVTSGYDAAYYLEPPPSDFPSGATIHDRLFRCRRVCVSDERLRKEKALRFDFDPPDTTRVEWTLSALGREKCELVFARFDLDDDGAWSYGEFLEYVAALEQERERPDIRAYTDNSEIWQMYMSDLFDTDAYFRLTFTGFMMYREAIEHDTPFECDLKVLEIPMKWDGLEKMRRYDRLFDEYADAEGGVELKTAHYLFAESGHAIPLQELYETVQRQRFLARCLMSVLNRKRSLRLFGYRQNSNLLYTNPQLEDEPKICKPAFLSLMLSSWIPTSKTVSGMAMTLGVSMNLNSLGALFATGHSAGAAGSCSSTCGRSRHCGAGSAQPRGHLITSGRSLERGYCEPPVCSQMYSESAATTCSRWTSAPGSHLAPPCTCPTTATRIVRGKMLKMGDSGLLNVFGCCFI